MTFTETELTVISNALRVAAERFDEHARQDWRGIEDQFRRQAKEARALYETIAEKTGICS